MKYHLDLLLKYGFSTVIYLWVTIQSWVSGRTKIPNNLIQFPKYVPIQEHFKRSNQKRLNRYTYDVKWKSFKHYTSLKKFQEGLYALEEKEHDATQSAISFPLESSSQYFPKPLFGFVLPLFATASV